MNYYTRMRLLLEEEARATGLWGNVMVCVDPERTGGFALEVGGDVIYPADHEEYRTYCATFELLGFIRGYAMAVEKAAHFPPSPEGD